MATVIDYVTPPAPRDTRTLQELFTSLHTEIVNLGPRGVVIVFGVLFSSTAVLLGRGARWIYQRARGYA